jgi:hypothetical protein
VVPGIGADDLEAMGVMDSAEVNLSPNGWNEVAVAESFCSVFGFVEVETKGSLTVLVAVGADLAVEYDLRSFLSSGENAINFVSSVPSVDSTPPRGGYGDCLFRVIAAERG